MNRNVFLPIMVFLLLVPLVSAVPSIQNITVSPSDELWLGEGAVISLNCSDTNSIENVYANITGPNIALPTLHFGKQGDLYTLPISKDYLDRTGQFDAAIYCRNNLSETASSAKSFSVSNLTGYVNQVSSPAYVGSTIEIDAIVNRNDIRLSSDVIFNVSLNGQLKNLKVMPAYDSNKGWILKVDSPQTSGIYELKVTAFYGRTSVTFYSSIDVRNSIEFNIESVDKKWIKSDDNVTVALKAVDKGSIIGLDKNNIEIRINSITAEVTSVSRRDNVFDVRIIAPTLSAGSYNLDAFMSYNGSSFSDSEPIDYIVSLEGSLTDGSNKAISTQIKFIQNSATKLTMGTDAYGHYSASIPPGVYNLEISFPKSTLFLYDVPVSSFDDPLRYFYGDDFDVPGISNAGLYDYEIDLSYSKAEIEMTYNEKNVVNEDNLRIFKCSEWNIGNNVCNEDWAEVAGELDTVRNRVKLTSSTLSAFVIGELKNLAVDFGPENDEYYLGDKIKIRGIVKDSGGDSVGNASIIVEIKNFRTVSTVADSNGVFSVEFPSPQDEGEYIVSLSAKRKPYIDFKGEERFKLVKKRSVYIDFPETVRIERGGNYTQEFSLVNNGQAEINNIDISLEGLPENYYNIVGNDVDLNPDEQKTLYIEFSIPVYAETGVTSATLKIESGNITEDKVFGMNIFKENESEAAPATGLFTGFELPEISYLEVLYISVFAVACFSVAIILKKRKVGGNRKDVKSYLLGVEKYVKTGVQPDGIQKSESYDKLIITEFPNVLKFSNELTQTKKGDK